MRILVIGKQGQLARALVEVGASAGVEIISAGRPECDIRNRDALEEAVTRVAPDLLVNAAAYTKVDQAESEAEEAFAVNAGGAANVARVCALADIPLVHLSTDYVFDGVKLGPYLEDDLTAPLNVYGRSKLEGEQAVLQLCPKSIVLRTSWVHSPWGHNFVKTMIGLAASRSVIDVVDDQRGCPTYAPHLAEAIVKIASRICGDRDPSIFGVYHAAGQGETNWYGFAAEVFARAQKRGVTCPMVRPISAAQYATPARRPANSRLDCTKLQAIFGIALPMWQIGVDACVKRADIAPPPVMGIRA